MAVNTSRSMTQSLTDGATDGKYRKLRPDTVPAPGAGSEETLHNRATLHPWWNYGYTDQQIPPSVMVNPGT